MLYLIEMDFFCCGFLNKLPNFILTEISSRKRKIV